MFVLKAVKSVKTLMRLKFCRQASYQYNDTYLYLLIQFLVFLNLTVDQCPSQMLNVNRLEKSN